MNNPNSPKTKHKGFPHIPTFHLNLPLFVTHDKDNSNKELTENIHNKRQKKIENQRNK